MGNPQEGSIFIPVLWYNERMINAHYLAGIIDGEGYLGILPVRSKETTNPCFEPVIKIGMTGKEAYRLFYAIKMTYGGTIEKRNKNSAGNREVYTYVLKGKIKIAEMLKDIKHLLVIKEEQARILWYFVTLPYNHPKSPNFRPDDIQYKIELYETLKALKRPPATTN